MTDHQDASRQSDGETINIDDGAEVGRWAQALCTSPEEVRAAAKAVGPEALRVKGYLFMMLVRRQNRRA